MPQIKYEVAGVENVETIPEDLVPFYTGRHGYTVVVDEAAAAELTGAELLEAARQAGVEAPTTLTADEKRHAIVDATAPRHPGKRLATAAVATRTKTVGGDADPTDPPADPQATTNSRAAAEQGE